jgi:uncharacterized membrane protein YvbJ
MFCTSCGKEINDQAIACPECGAPTKNFNEQSVEKVAKAEKKFNGLSIAGFVCAFIFPFLGLLFSIIGLVIACKKQEAGKGLAIAGIVISVAFLVPYIIMYNAIFSYLLF